MHWKAGAFDDLFQGIADDQMQAVLTDLEVSRVLAPYDGGFDVICSPAEVGKLRHQFTPWLSSRADGL